MTGNVDGDCKERGIWVRTLNHVSQGEAMRTPISAASFIQSRFWAAAVRNMALLFTLPWN